MRSVFNSCLFFKTLFTFTCFLASGWVYGQAGAGLAFNGVFNGNRIQLSTNIVSGSGSFSVECWAKGNAASSNDYGPIFCQGDDGTVDATLQIGFVKISSISYFRISFGGATDLQYTGSQTSDNAFHHWAAVYETTTNFRAIYCDGVLVASDTPVNDYLGSSYNQYIGYSGLNGNSFYGVLDEIRVWTKALCINEINFYKNCEISTTPSNLAANYHCNQGTASGNNTGITTLIDGTGAVPGNLINFTKTGSASNFVTPGGVVSGTTCGTYLPNEINIQGNGVNIIDGDGTPALNDFTDLGATLLVNTQSRTYTIQNTGTGPLNITLPIVVTGPQAANFTITTPPAATVAAGSSTTFTVTFAPTALSLNTATINITNSDCDETLYDFAIQGFAYITRPGSGQTLTFNGTNSLVTVPSTPSLQLSNGNFSIEYWAKPNSVAVGGKWVIGKENGNANLDYLIGLDANQWRFIARNLSIDITGPSNVVVNQWYHVVCTFDGTTAKLYVNGFQVGSDATVGAAYVDASVLRIGARTPGPTQFFNGSIDEIRIFKTALPQPTIRDWMCRKLNPSHPDYTTLTAYYRFDENIGTVLYDLAKGFANHGTLVNAPTWGFSGAALGDTSVFKYSSPTTSVDLDETSNLSIPAIQRDRISIANFDVNAANKGIQVYKVRESPYYTAASGNNILETSRYFGVFPVGTSNYTSAYNYTNNTNLNGVANEKTIVKAQRLDNAGTTWSRVAGTTLNITSKVVASPIGTPYTTRAEIIPAFSTDGAALNFDGSNDRITATVDINPATRPFLTVEAWVYRTANTGGYQAIVSNDNGGYDRAIMINSSGNFAIFANRLETTTIPSLLNTWEHIAVTWSASQINFYKNGVVVFSAAGENAGVGTTNVGIGNGVGISYPFSGTLDEVRIWNRVLCPAEIQNNMNCEIPTTGTGLVANYHFNQGIAAGTNTGLTSLTDASTNGNTGTLTGFNLTGTTSNWVTPGGVVSGSNCSPYLAPEINLQGNALNIVTGDITPSLTDGTSLGSLMVGANITQTFTIQNLGTGTLNLSLPITFTGANAGDYTISVPPSATVAPAGSTTFTVSFTPSGTGLRSATINIVHDDCDESPYTFGLEGTGVMPIMPVGNRDIYFDGVDDKVVCPVVSLTNFSIEFWVKTTQTGTIGTNWFDGMGLIDADGATNDYGISLNGNKICAGLGNSSFDRSFKSNASVNNGAWHHVAVTRNGANMQMYIDGILDNTYVATGITGSVGQVPLTFGRKSVLGGGAFNGQLDEIKIFNTVRTPLEILGDMSDISTTTPGLVSYWNFEDDAAAGNQTTATDVTSNTNDGTLDNTPLWALRVTNNTDIGSAGLGSLRQALIEANTDTDKDYIDFSIQQSNTVSQININSQLGVINPILLDGYSAHGSAPNTNAFNAGQNTALRVELNFGGMGNAPDITAIQFTNVDSALVKGLSFFGLQNTGGGRQTINFNNGNRNRVSGCWFGLKANGTADYVMNGLYFINGGNNVVGYAGNTPDPASFNVFANCIYQGLNTSGGSGTVIQGNYIGVAQDGKTNAGFNAWGIYVNASGCVVRNNVIGFCGPGIRVTASNLVVQNNKIGIAADGTTATGNYSNGIMVESGTNNLIGGDSSIHMNIIANNGTSGINLNGVNGAVVKRNSIHCNNTTNTSGIINSAVSQPTLSGYQSGAVTNLTISNLSVVGTKNIYLYKNTLCGQNQGEIFVDTVKNVASGSSTYNYTSSGKFALGDKITVMYVSASGSSIFSNLLNLSLQGAALNFDGSNDFVETNTNITELAKGDFTIQAWVKTTGTNVGLVICTDADDVWEIGEKTFYLNNLGQPCFVGYANAFIIGNTAVNDGNWHHVAVTWDYTGGTSGIGRIYVDGANATGSVSYTANNTNTGSFTFKFGRANFGGANEAQNYLTGSLDEVRIWNRALCQSEIQNNRNCELPSNSSSLKANYHFNQGLASGLNTSEIYSVDSSGNAYTGSLLNFGLSGATSNWIAPGGVVSGTSCAPYVAVPTVYTVTNTNNAGAGSFRQAIINANANCGQDTIKVTTVGTLTLGSTLPVITDAVVIKGNNLVVSGNNLYSVFSVNNVVANFQNLTIKDGYAKGGDGQAPPSPFQGAGGGGGAGMGGGLFVIGTNSNVILSNVIFSNNKAEGGKGGNGIFTGSVFTGTGGNGGVSSHPSFGGAAGIGGASGVSGTDGGLFSGGGGAGHVLSSAANGSNGGGFAGGGGNGVRTDGDTLTRLIGQGGFLGGNASNNQGGSCANGGGGGAGLGGAIFAYQGILSLNNVSFLNNSSVGGLGGSTCNPSISGAKGMGKGSAVFVYSGVSLTSTGCSFDANVSSHGLCLPLDNEAYYNANGSAISLFPAQTPYGLSKAGISTQNSVNLIWSTCVSKPITEYILEKSINDTLSYSVIQSGSTATTFTDNSLLPNNTYFYRLKASTADGSSGQYSHLVVSTFKKAGSGTSVNFDGTNDYVHLKDLALDVSNGFSISFWANPTSNAYYARFVDFSNGLDKDNIIIGRSGSTNDLLFRVIKGNNVFGSFAVNNALELNVWQHFAAVYSKSANLLKLYKNGVLIGQITVTDTLTNVNRSKTYLGKSPWNTDQYYQGSMDEVSIWQKALSVAEIRQYMCRKLKGNEAGLLTNLRLDEGQGIGAENKAFSGVGAYLMNAPTWVQSGAPIGDTSSYVYDAGATVTLTDGGDQLGLNSFSLTTGKGLQLYKVKDAITVSPIPGGFTSVDTVQHYGIFPVGAVGNYSLVQSYRAALDPKEIGSDLIRRDDHSIATWVATGSIPNNGGNLKIISPTSGRNEYMMALNEVPIAPDSLIAWSDYQPTTNTYRIQLTLKDKSLNETAFVIEYDTLASFSSGYSVGFGVASNATSYTLIGLIPNKNHFFRISSKNGIYTSLPSNVAKAVPVIQSGKAILFDGVVGQRLEGTVSAWNLGTSNFTLEAWIKTSSNGHVLWSKRQATSNGFFFNTEIQGGTGVLTFETDNNGVNYTAVIGNTRVDDGKWHHVAWVRNGLFHGIYVDGQLDNSAVATGLANTSSGAPLAFGGRYNGLSPIGNFIGEVDELRIWNVARSQAQLNALKDKPLIGSENGLLGLWHVDEQSGNIAYNGSYNTENLNWINVLNVSSKAMHPYKPTGLSASAGTFFWTNPNIAKDVKSYKILKKITSTFDSIGTTSSAVNTFGYTITCTDQLYKVVGVDSAGQVGFVSDSLVISKPANGGAGTWTWTGAVSINWFDACNWDKNCLPDALSDVVIPGATLNEPSIAGTNAYCKTINIVTTNGGHVTINTGSGGKLNLTP